MNGSEEHSFCSFLNIKSFWFVIPDEDGSVLRFRQHGGRQLERLPALPAEGDRLPATETIPAPPLPQRSHQVCVCVCVLRFYYLFNYFLLECIFSPSVSFNPPKPT